MNSFWRVLPDGDDSIIRLYLADIGDHELLSRDLQNELFARLDELAPDRLQFERGEATNPPAHCMGVIEEIASHLYKLVFSVAKKYAGRGVSLEDLIQTGNEVLIKTIWRFDSSRDVAISTYAVWWLRRSMGVEIERYGRTIRHPVHILKALKQIRTASDRLGGYPGVAEIAKETGLSKDKVSALLELNKPLLSVDNLIYADDNDQSDHCLFLADNSPAAQDCAEQAEREEAIEAAIIELDPRTATIIEMRFGLNGYGGKRHTLQECADRMELTRERIRQLERDGLRELARSHPELAGYL